MYTRPDVTVIVGKAGMDLSNNTERNQGEREGGDVPNTLVA